MPKTYRKIAATLALGTVGVSLGFPGAPAAQAAPHTYRSYRPTVHPRVPTPPASYLQYKVYTVDQLIQQVANNPVVRDRFARHFHLSDSRVVEYMRANLVESYIPKTGRYTVYCVRRSGKFYPVRQTFHQGTKVFALRNGEPVMKWVCGNPLTKFASTVTDIVSNKPTIKPPMVAEFIPSDLDNEIVPTEGAQIEVSPSIESLVSPVSSAVGSRSSNLAYAFLPALGLLGLRTGGSSSTPHAITPEVPEPASLVYLVVGVPLVLLGVRNRKSLKKQA